MSLPNPSSNFTGKGYTAKWATSIFSFFASDGSNFLATVKQFILSYVFKSS